jgi:hypothetical protein
VQTLRGADVEVQETRERQINVDDLVEGDALGEAAEGSELSFRKRERRLRTKRRPFSAIQINVT